MAEPKVMKFKIPDGYKPSKFFSMDKEGVLLFENSGGGKNGKEKKRKRSC